MRMKILIIEDHEPSAVGLCKLLTERMEFVDCKIVRTLAEGLALSHEFEADVTTLDLVLPDATRQQVLEAIEHMFPPVVVVSALIEDDSELASQCWMYGAKGVLSKRGLLETIMTLDGIVQKARFIDAVTGSHLRATAPALRAERKNGHGTASP